MICYEKINRERWPARPASSSLVPSIIYALSCPLVHLTTRALHMWTKSRVFIPTHSEGCKQLKARLIELLVFRRRMGSTSCSSAEQLRRISASLEDMSIEQLLGGLEKDRPELIHTPGPLKSRNQYANRSADGFIILSYLDTAFNAFTLAHMHTR